MGPVGHGVLGKALHLQVVRAKKIQPAHQVTLFDSLYILPGLHHHAACFMAVRARCNFFS